MTAEKKSLQGTSRLLFFEFSGHVACIKTEVIKTGWEAWGLNGEGTLRFEAYLDEDLGDSLEYIKRKLQEVKNAL